MPGLRIAQVADLLGVSGDTVRRLLQSGALRGAPSQGRQRLVDPVDVARYMSEHAPHITPAPVVGRSARNRFPGIVTRVEKDGVAAVVEIQAGPHRVVSLLTAEAVDELGLVPGMVAVASVKSTNVVVEVPGTDRPGR